MIFFTVYTPHAMQNKKQSIGADGMLAHFIASQLSKGTVEYYHKDFSIHIDWDGKLDFTFQVRRTADNHILETSLVTHYLGDNNQVDPPLLVVWDKVMDELDRLKTKYILDYNGDISRYPRATSVVEG